MRRSAEEHRSAPRGAVLYVHGYVDYFFQIHLAEAFSAAGFDFHALDLRRYGRSLRWGNVPNQCDSIDDYFVEMDWAIDRCCKSTGRLAALVGHSTGGLVTALYASRGPQRDRIDNLVLNSPFFEFPANGLERALLRGLIALGKRRPLQRVPLPPSSAYGESIHRHHRGEWLYDLTKKPLEGFGVRAGWLNAVARGHAEVQAGLDIRCPVLILHSDKSRRPGRHVAEPDFRSDVVLNVEHMKKFGPRLGPRVELQEIADGLHDVTLSRLPVRTHAIERMVAFCER